MKVPGYAELTPSSQPERLAVVSLALGIAGIIVCPLIVPSIVAIILGLVARGRINRESQKSGSGMAMAGVLSGFVGLLIIPLLVTLYLPRIRDAIDEGVGNVVDVQAETSLREAAATAKTIYTNGSTYRNVTQAAATAAGDTRVWTADGESTDANVISFLVVSDVELRLAARSASGRCVGLLDNVVGGGARWAVLDEAPSCTASTFGPGDFVLLEPPTAT